MQGRGKGRDLALRSLSLCAGIGAHDIALRRWCSTVGYVERDAFAASILVGGRAQAILDQAPIWDDLRTFESAAWRGCVDLVSSGLPCQPYSVAGKRRGNDDERAIWPELVRIVRECEPAFVFIENTPEFLTHAEPVWRELRGLGFEWEEPLFVTASHVGAIHKRRRVFLLAAHRDRAGLALGESERRDAREERASAERDRRGAADTDGAGFEGEWCGWVFDSERQTFRHDAHRCSDRCRTRGTHWDSESPVCRVDAGSPYRADLLRVLGNAVPPQQTERAFQELIGGLVT